MDENNKKICFIIAPIGDEGSDIRNRSDQILKHIFTPIAKEHGFEAIRADKISEPGIITSQVIQHLLDDHLVIADLTGHNPNVFYELAIRHAIKKPCIQVIRKGDKIPFDIAQSRIILLDHTDMDSVENCKDEIRKQIKSSFEPSYDIDTPISLAVDIKFLRQSGNPLEKSNAEIITMIQQLAQKIDDIPKYHAEEVPYYFRTCFSVLHMIIDLLDSSKEDVIKKNEIVKAIFLLDELEQILRGFFMSMGYLPEWLPEYKEKRILKLKQKKVIKD